MPEQMSPADFRFHHQRIVDGMYRDYASNPMPENLMGSPDRDDEFNSAYNRLIDYHHEFINNDVFKELDLGSRSPEQILELALDKLSEVDQRLFWLSNIREQLKQGKWLDEVVSRFQELGMFDTSGDTSNSDTTDNNPNTSSINQPNDENNPHSSENDSPDNGNNDNDSTNRPSHLRRLGNAITRQVSRAFKKFKLGLIEIVINALQVIQDVEVQAVVPIVGVVSGAPSISFELELSAGPVRLGDAFQWVRRLVGNE